MKYLHRPKGDCFLVAVDKVEAFIADMLGRLIVVFPVLYCPVLGDLGTLGVDVFELKTLEDEERSCDQK